MIPRFSYYDLLHMIPEPNRKAHMKLYADNRFVFDDAFGSKSKHQSWPGGYLDHIADTMNIACLLYPALVLTGRDVPFELSDALEVLHLHDVEKPWKQQHMFGLETAGVKNDGAIADFKYSIIKKYGIVLTPQMENALKYVEGEGNDYDPFNRVMGELGAFCHSCDVLSARLWHDYPKEKGRW